MAQHDNGRRNAGLQAGAWQQGQRDPQDFSSNQQDQSGGRYGSSYGAGQQGSHLDQGGAPGQQNQWEHARQQHGDEWRERQGPAAGGWRPAMEERDRSWNDSGPGAHTSYGGGRGSFGGQASDNDYGNRGITERGNFGNDGGGDWNAGSGRDRTQGGARGREQTWGQSSADPYQGSRGPQNQGPSNRDRYGDDGYQSNWQQGQQGHAFHDPDYHQWRAAQMDKLDRDYAEWRQQRYQRFSEDFDKWRADRDNQRNAGAASAASGQQGEASGTQSGTSRHDISSTGDKGGAGKSATK
jgi:hypothetical protein